MRRSLSQAEKKRRRARLLGWWYACIGAAFILLGLRSLVRGDAVFPIALRFLIAIGFFVLSIGTLRTSNH